MATKTGERKLQILQTLAQMLEKPSAEKITTAALAARLDVSEAALYRHFASKAQMFEGLIAFIEETIFGLVTKIGTEHASGLAQTEAILTMLLGFARKNQGMTRVLIGDALVNENERLQLRINQLHDRLETTLKQALRFAISQKDGLIVRNPTTFTGKPRAAPAITCDCAPEKSMSPVVSAVTWIVDATRTNCRSMPSA